MQRSIQLHMAGADASVESEPTPDDQAPSQSGPGRADQLAEVRARRDHQLAIAERAAREPVLVAQEVKRFASAQEEWLAAQVYDAGGGYACEHHLVERRKMVTNM
jgi:hypothetical protein